MKNTFVLLFIVLVIASGESTNACQCSELTIQTDCMYAGCEWEDSQTQCFDKLPANQPICSNYDDQLTCDLLKGCAWTNDEHCAQFTKCSDYMIDSNDSADQCYLKDHSCVKGSMDSKGFITCSTIADVCQNNDQLFQNSNSMNSDLNHYTSTVDFQLTSIFNCISQRKVEQKCSDITNQVICTFLKNDESFTICEWKNNKCVQITSTPQLSSRNCYLRTGGTYSWNNNQCQICSGDPKQNLMTEKINTLSSITNLIATSVSQFNITLNPQLVQQTNCNRTYDSTILQNCFAYKCLQQITSSENISCRIEIDNEIRIDYSTSTNCSAQTESLNDENVKTTQNSKTALNCNSDFSNSTFINENIVEKTTVTTKTQNQCFSNSNLSQDFNSQSQCNQTINSHSKSETDQDVEENYVETQCHSNTDALQDNKLDKIQIISNSECIVITNNDPNTISKISKILEETKINENIMIQSKISEMIGGDNIITNCNTNGDEQDKEIQNTEDKVDQSINSFFKTDCIAITNGNKTTSIPSSSVIENKIISKTYPYDSSFLDDSHPSKLDQVNNCTNGSNCSITVKSKAQLFTIAILFILDW